MNASPSIPFSFEFVSEGKAMKIAGHADEVRITNNQEPGPCGSIEVNINARWDKCSITQEASALASIIRHDGSRFSVFVGAGGGLEELGWDIVASTGFSCTYATADPEKVRLLQTNGWRLDQSAVDALTL